MAAVFDSAPECVRSVAGATPADDSADFVVGAAYEQCAGVMTFGPGSTYGEEGAAATGAYLAITWVGIAFMVVVLVAWVLFERRRLIGHVARLGHWSDAARGGVGGMGALPATSTLPASGAGAPPATGKGTQPAGGAARGGPPETPV